MAANFWQVCLSAAAMNAFMKALNRPRRHLLAVQFQGMSQMSASASRERRSQRLVAFAGRPLAFIFFNVMKHAPSHAIVLGAVLFAVSFSVFSQYALKHLVDVLSSHDVAHLWSAFALLAGIIAADNLTWRIGGWTATHAFVAVTGDIRRVLFAHLLGHSPAYFADRLPGALASRITATANAVYTVESLFAWNVLPPCFMVLLSIGLLASVNATMAAVLGTISVAMGALLIRLAAKGRPLHRAYARDAAIVDGELVDVIGNIAVVRAFGASLRERVRFDHNLGQEMRTRRLSLRYMEKLRLLHAVFTAVLTAGLMCWALLLWQHGRASTGGVVLVSTLGFNILHGTRDLAVALVEMVQHVARLAESLATLLVPHELSNAANAHWLRPQRGRVEFQNVCFAYPEGGPVLRNFNLVVEPGTRVGLVGRSGAGKSTVLALLQRLRDVESGQILIDGQDIRRITLASLHKAISVVPQDVMMFHRSVMENIRYGRPDATDEEVFAAARAANCLDFIQALPQGFDTIVGERGVKLSGGQRQRLAIARAFLCNAPVLLLDEATSALDSESEQYVQQALDRLMTGRTVIAVAHRLATLKNFDRIVVMEAGQIVQDGSPQELERVPGPYRQLLRRQALRLVETEEAEAA